MGWSGFSPKWSESCGFLPCRVLLTLRYTNSKCFAGPCNDGAGHHLAQDRAEETTKSTSRTNRAAAHRIIALAQRLASPEFGSACEEVWPSHVHSPGASAMHHRFVSGNGHGVSQERGCQFLVTTPHKSW